MNPPLQKTQERGTPRFRMGKRETRIKGVPPAQAACIESAKNIFVEDYDK